MYGGITKYLIKYAYVCDGSITKYFVKYVYVYEKWKKMEYFYIFFIILGGW